MLFLMQSIQCHGRRTHRLVPHLASAKDLIDCRIRSRGTPTETIMQLCLVIQAVWNSIPQEWITHLGPIMPRRCRVVHDAHTLTQTLLILSHLVVCFTQQNATIKFCLSYDDSRQIGYLAHVKKVFGQCSRILDFPLKLRCVSFFSSLYIKDVGILCDKLWS